MFGEKFVCNGNIFRFNEEVIVIFIFFYLFVLLRSIFSKILNLVYIVKANMFREAGLYEVTFKISSSKFFTLRVITFKYLLLNFRLLCQLKFCNIVIINVKRELFAKCKVIGYNYKLFVVKFPNLKLTGRFSTVKGYFNYSLSSNLGYLDGGVRRGIRLISIV